MRAVTLRRLVLLALVGIAAGSSAWLIMSPSPSFGPGWTFYTPYSSLYVGESQDGLPLWRWIPWLCIGVFSLGALAGGVRAFLRRRLGLGVAIVSVALAAVVITYWADPVFRLNREADGMPNRYHYYYFAEDEKKPDWGKLLPFLPAGCMVAAFALIQRIPKEPA